MRSWRNEPQGKTGQFFSLKTFNCCIIYDFFSFREKWLMVFDLYQTKSHPFVAIYMHIGSVGMMDGTDLEAYFDAYETLLCWVLVDPNQRHGFL
jgi:hypothetical protein